MDKLYLALANGRRELQGLGPLPTPPELRDTKDDVIYTLRHVIPACRETRAYQRGEGKDFLDHWQNSELEKLNALDKGGQSDE